MHPSRKVCHPRRSCSYIASNKWMQERCGNGILWSCFHAFSVAFTACRTSSSVYTSAIQSPSRSTESLKIHVTSGYLHCKTCEGDSCSPHLGLCLVSLSPHTFIIFLTPHMVDMFNQPVPSGGRDSTECFFLCHPIHLPSVLLNNSLLLPLLQYCLMVYMFTDLHSQLRTYCFLSQPNCPPFSLNSLLSMMKRNVLCFLPIFLGQIIYLHIEPTHLSNGVDGSLSWCPFTCLDVQKSGLTLIMLCIVYD